MRCPSEFEKAYVQHRRIKRDFLQVGGEEVSDLGGREILSPALTWGSYWHVAMETHYSAPEMSEADLIDNVILRTSEAWVDHGVSDDHRTLARLHLEYRKYLRQYGLPWKEASKTVGWPDRPAVELNGEVAIPGARHPYAYKIDRIFKEQGQYFVEDHKTTSRFDKNFFRAYELDNQMMGYAVSAELLIGKPIAGVRISAAVIHTKDSLYERRTIPFSRPRLDHWIRNYDRWLGQIEHAKNYYNELVASGEELSDSPADIAFPLNLWACGGRKYGLCPYFGVCSYPPHLRQRVLEQDFAVKQWNPLESGDAGSPDAAE